MSCFPRATAHLACCTTDSIARSLPVHTFEVPKWEVCERVTAGKPARVHMGIITGQLQSGCDNDSRRTKHRANAAKQGSGSQRTPASRKKLHVIASRRVFSFYV